MELKQKKAAQLSRADKTDKTQNKKDSNKDKCSCTYHSQLSRAQKRMSRFLGSQFQALNEGLQKDFCEAHGINASSFSSWLGGKRGNRPSDIAVLQWLAEYHPEILLDNLTPKA